jgi:hypothetical protein
MPAQTPMPPECVLWLSYRTERMQIWQNQTHD